MKRRWRYCTVLCFDVGMVGLLQRDDDEGWDSGEKKRISK